MLKHNLFVPLILLMTLVSIPIAFARPNLSEEQVQAVYLYNFSKFITWPEEAFQADDSPFNICILGEDPFNETLNSAIQGETARERIIDIVFFKTFNEQTLTETSCQTLFITDEYSDELAEIFAISREHAILTVSNIENFVKRGGMIEFYISNSKVRFFIEPDSVRNVGLDPSAKLLRVASVVSNN